ncbi:CYTH domain-containing protein [Streptococcus pacificus]|uniref:CYTH domain-containing protein n=1 Tax=Streptococcus pacificus TaxID=2740577 RepID=A0ABS0ZJG0_9STRE|nr:CYTH domain-containing protein [Streptococcus pacificus]MBJ8326138.1 hypothetical protein [Streptococcus pacificus]
MKIDSNTSFMREIEQKYHIVDKNLISYCIQNLIRENFYLENHAIETDFVPDFYNDYCKRKGIVIRYRIIQPGSYLLTIKTKNQSQNNNLEVQDNLELEYDSFLDTTDRFKEIQKFLKEDFDIDIPDIILKNNDLHSNIIDLVSALYKLGFVKCRMITQKNRKTYKRDKMSVCIDHFPHEIGDFVEIEALNMDDFIKLKNIVSLPSQLIERENYGNIIQKRRLELGNSKNRSRVCLFDSIIENFIYERFSI